MNKSTPPKHKTPNYRLVTHVLTAPALHRFAAPRRHVIRVAWEPAPLRPTRKDLAS